MKSFSSPITKWSIVFLGLFLVGTLSRPNYASVVIPSDIPTPDSLIIFTPFTMHMCTSDGTCIFYDAPWTNWDLPTLPVGQPASLSTASTSFAFYLGDSLYGAFEVYLTPFFQGVVPDVSGDELIAIVANRNSVLARTSAGMATFEAVSGSDYYLLLSGYMRGGETYHLAFSPAPSPAPFWLLGVGLIVLVLFNTRTGSQSTCNNLCA